MPLYQRFDLFVGEAEMKLEKLFEITDVFRLCFNATGMLQKEISYVVLRHPNFVRQGLQHILDATNRLRKEWMKSADGFLRIAQCDAML